MQVPKWKERYYAGDDVWSQKPDTPTFADVELVSILNDEYCQREEQRGQDVSCVNAWAGSNFNVGTDIWWQCKAEAIYPQLTDEKYVVAEFYCYEGNESDKRGCKDKYRPARGGYYRSVIGSWRERLCIYISINKSLKIEPHRCKAEYYRNEYYGDLVERGECIVLFEMLESGFESTSGVKQKEYRDGVKNGKVENCRNIAYIWILDESVAGMIDDFFIDERAVEKANSCGDCGSKDAEGHCPHVWF